MIKEINFSKKAVERINELVSKKPSGTFFRIAVKGGGCSGFKYDFTFDNKMDDNDFKYSSMFLIRALTEFTFQELIFIKMKKKYHSHKKILFLDLIS